MLEFNSLLFKLKNNIFEYKNNKKNNKDKKELLQNIKNEHYYILEKLYQIRYKDNNKLIHSDIVDLLKLCLYTRDKYYGIGMLDIFIVQLHNFILFSQNKIIHPKNIELILDALVFQRNEYQTIGSWKDYKYILDYLIKEQKMDKENPFVQYIIQKYVKQVNNDYYNILNGSLYKELSYCCKWIPREKSKYSWIVPLIVKKMFNIEQYRVSKESYYSYLKNYRQIITYINNILQTPEIYMCENRWSKICFCYKSNNFYKKYHYSFMLDKNNKYYSKDRLECSENYHIHCNNRINMFIEKNNYIQDKNYELINDYKNKSIRQYYDYIYNLYSNIYFDNYYFY